MEDLLIETLETFGYPVRLQGSLLEDEPYPDNFFTFWDNGSSGESYYDNGEVSTLFHYDVNFYSVDSALVYIRMREAKRVLEASGFLVDGEGHTVMSDEKTHDGRGFDVLYIKTKTQTEG